MPSEIVWNDAYARASAVAEKQGLPIGDPLTWDFSSNQEAFAALDLASSSIERLELGDQQAQESGQICIMLWIPQGKMNTPTVLSIMNAFEATFRTEPVDPNKRWPAGLFYDGQNYTPPSFLGQTGNWYVATLMVDYRWQNITEQTP
ncbi:hypothetical protein [Acetobacter pasteurianus]|uniref:Uncharacterized protein n=1 Tax=Acetobacter pasteurianus (strain NBRC 105184 / IFO 3283-01) TaxID=634452 RepID=C7JDC0_ACEP3|nr:hypothetical protein [Acetobacter pasteurianus]BAI00132.1 hypothetical protein APA01_20100 [Acetobacter pasteurianus IFO 3283-01]BAI03185.1 hypothetical protein APA03_20100 [Acetobacter pasteurianus IFO 3283-03]BAI06230.1 hypothetical protein APA07_20100 [Acetobacter pasteurianus IFO 3283-07]BAI09280.1 hypothetical protein APA22_20100 [Acetobacter pasteurianus IFO 3283-22]BAI12328.1 hypothetical protein APA26_20100 [Acetobacter pasteurianus IFO 3283-26]